MKMKVKLDKGAYMPTRAHVTDAGYDLRSREYVLIHPHSSAEFDTGVHIELPPGKCAVVISKSGLNINNDITSTGLVDEGYNGSIRVKLYNHNDDFFKVCKGDKISQFFVTDYYGYELELVEELEDTERGSAGFGSTGAR